MCRRASSSPTTTTRCGTSCAQTLSKDGFDVLQVSNGGRLLVALAREIVAKPGPDLVDLLVSDIRMPVCTGIQILEQIRASGWRMPVI